MPKKTAIFLYFLLVLAVGLGYNYFFKPFKAAPQPLVTEVEPSPSPSLDPVSALLEGLSDSDKVGLVLAAPVVVDDELLASPSALAATVELRPGMVTLFGDRVTATAAASVISQLKQQLVQPTVLVAVDHEGGAVQRLSGPGFTFLPSWQQLCQFSQEKKLELLTASAQELRQVGVDVVWGPMVDFATKNTVLGSRLCSSDAVTVIENARVALATYRAAGLMPVLKHFPGIGQTTQDLHQAFDTVEITPTEASVYQVLLEEYPEIGVMVSHVGVSNQFAGVPCSQSLPCVGQVAANYPRTLIVTDALEMISAGHLAQDPTKPRDRTAPLAATLEDRAVAAINAGNQVLVFGPTVLPAQLEAVKERLIAEMATDPSFADKITAAARRVVEVQWGNDVVGSSFDSSSLE